MVIWEPDRQRITFAMLQRRITAGVRVLQLARAHPAHYVFDLLADQHGPLLDQQLSVRRWSRGKEHTPITHRARLSGAGDGGEREG